MGQINDVTVDNNEWIFAVISLRKWKEKRFKAHLRAATPIKPEEMRKK